MAAATFTNERHPLLTAIRDVDKAVAVARDLLPFVVDPTTLGDAVCELLDVQSRIDGLRLQLLTQANANGVPHTSKVRTMDQFVAGTSAHCGQSTKMDMSTVRWLYDFGEFRDAAYTGVLTAGHLRRLRELSNERTNEELTAWQTFFVDAAGEQSCFENFNLVCKTWFVKYDPDGKEPKDQIEKNSLKFQKGAGDRGRMIADMDGATYKAVKKIIEHESAKIKAEAKAAGKNPVDDDDFAPRVAPNMSESGRRLSGLFRVLTRGYAREDGTFPAPLLNIVMSLKVAEWTLRQLQNPGLDCGPVPIDPFDIDGRCELTDGTIIHPLLVAAMCGFHQFDIPTLRRYVMDAKARIVDYSYNARIHPEHLRTASLIEHRGRCAQLGCTAPEHWLQMDHNHPDSHGGETKLSNTQPLCGGDNQAKTNTTGHTRWIDRPPPKRRPRTPPPDTTGATKPDEPDTSNTDNRETSNTDDP